jgi:hypothetical protein
LIVEAIGGWVAIEQRVPIVEAICRSHRLAVGGNTPQGG